jgi:hypothetical protein
MNPELLYYAVTSMFYISKINAITIYFVYYHSKITMQY